jgi:hypothetical protein
LRQFGCLTGAKKVCWPPFTILWLLEPTLKGDLIVLGFYGVVNVVKFMIKLMQNLSTPPVCPKVTI